MSGMQGFEMMFPVIKVQDNGHKEPQTRIVGTNSHDTLYIDRKTKGIHYYNLQNGEGTKGDYEFVGNENEWSSDLRIEFVTIDELLNIYKNEMQIAAEQEKAMREFIKEWRSKKEAEDKESREKGIFHT